MKHENNTHLFPFLELHEDETDLKYDGSEKEEIIPIQDVLERIVELRHDHHGEEKSSEHRGIGLLPYENDTIRKVYMHTETIGKVS